MKFQGLLQNVMQPFLTRLRDAKAIYSTVGDVTPFYVAIPHLLFGPSFRLLPFPLPSSSMATDDVAAL